MSQVIKKQYTVEDGLASNTVYCIEQDELGYIWLGTDKGLSRFDGIEFVNFSDKDGLLDSEILHFHKDSQGRIWYYTLNGKIGYLKDGQHFGSLDTLNIDAREQIVSIEDFKEEMYLATRTEVRKFDGVHIDSVDGISTYHPSIIKILGQLFLVGERAVFKYDTVDNEFEYHGKMTIPRNWNSYLTTKDEYIVSYRNLNSISGFDTWVITYNINNGQSHSTPTESNQILNIKTIENSVWFFTLDRIFKFDPYTNTYKLYKKEEFPNDAMIDRDGNLWITTHENGIKLSPSKTRIKEILKNPNLKFSKVIDNKTYIVSNETQLIRLDNGKLKPELDFIGRISWANESKYGQLMAGGYSRLYLNNQFYKVYSTAADFDQNYLYVGSIEKILRFKVAKNGITLTHKDSLKEIGKARHLISLDSTQVIFSNDNGVFIKTLDHKSPLERIDIKSRISHIHKDQFGLVWLASNGQGLFCLDKQGNMFNISVKDGLSSNYIDMVTSKDEDVWIMHSTGIDIIHNALTSITNKQTLKIAHISDIPGVLKYIEPADTGVYITTSTGLYWTPHHIETSQETAPRINIEWIELDSVRDFSKPHHFSAKPETQRISIKYSAPYFQPGQKVRFRYRLLYNQNTTGIWTNTRITTISFDNLKSGSYQLELQCRTDNTDWSESKMINFEIEPFWWDQMWVKWLEVVLLSVILTLIVIRIRYVRNARKRLASEKLFAELAAKKAQFKSHFVFNALNSVKNYILTNNIEQSDHFLTAYSKLMRRILDLSEKLFIPLREELELIELYLTLEQMRSRNRFDFTIQIAPEIDINKTLCPSMITQPFVENAVWHGVMPLNRTGHITIQIAENDKYFIIRIEDDGVGFTSHPGNKESHDSWGTKIISEKMRLLKESYNIAIEMEVESQEGQGTKISLFIPKNNEQSGLYLF